MKPVLPEALQLAPSLSLVWILWYWVGVRSDRRWLIVDKVPWIALLVFNLVSLVEHLPRSVTRVTFPMD